MRSFIIAAIILASIIVMIIISSLYITAKIDSLLELCCELESNSSADSVELLLSEWQSCKDILALSVHETEINRANDAILALHASQEAPSEFYYYLSILKSALRSIGNGGRLSFDKIF